MLTRRIFLTLAGSAAVAPALPAWAGGPPATTIGGDAFGSFWRLTVPETPTGLDGVAARLEAIVAEVDALFSPYRADSQLSGFNAAPDTDWRPVDPALGDVLAQGLEIAGASAGAFDPTVGPIVGRYGFGPIEAGTGGHFGQLAVNGSAIRKAEPDLCIDLCGIAKGHALDRMVAALDGAGVGHYLLDLGGELYGRGSHPGGRDWQVAIDAPLGADPVILALRDRAIATSGNTVQGYEIGGRRIGHVIDPVTESPASGRTLSVSVLSDDAAHADGWATALMAMDHERALALAERLGLDTLFLLEDGPDARPVMTGRFADHRLV